MRYCILTLVIATCAGYAMKADARFIQGIDVSGKECSKASAEDLSKTMLTTDPKSWKKFEDKDFPYTLTYPPQLVRAEVEDSKQTLLLAPDWCGKVANASEILKLQVNTKAPPQPDKKAGASEQNRQSAEYLRLMMFPGIASNPTNTDTLDCGEGGKFDRIITNSNNRNWHYTRQAISIPHGEKIYEFAFTYSNSTLPEHKEKTDRFIKDNDAIECAVLSSVKFIR